MIRRKIIATILLLFFIGYNLQCCAITVKYPDYATEYLGPDKHENFNRKMFNFNLGLNKYCIRPLHILWASIFPQYVMDRILGITFNIEYPIRLMSNLVQRDFKRAGHETVRFFVNTTVGLGGMFDPAKRYLHIDFYRDNMDKALSKCNIKQGPYFVLPVIVFTSPRGILGRILDTAFNPSTYIGSPILAAIKASMTLNRSAYLQYIIILLETNFTDPYYITKLGYGLDKYIKKNNYDRIDIISQLMAENNIDKDYKKIKRVKNKKKTKLEVSAKIVDEKNKNANIKEAVAYQKDDFKSEILLKDYAPQAPVTDSMRTMLFNLPDASKSIWNEVSPWNHSFINRTKTMPITVFEGREKYTFRYLMQKDKNAPLAIIYPSTGDGIYSNHPLMFGKLFYDAGYSIIIEGNPFNSEFIKSMPDGYAPGLPSKDALMMRETTLKIIDTLQQKYKCTFGDKVVFGTSLAALDVLYMAEAESKDNKLGQADFIAICPPIDLMYSVKQVDSYAQEFLALEDDLKQKVAYASAKLTRLFLTKDDIDFPINRLPFDEDEAKLFTSFMMHQKLANVIFTLEKAPTNKKSDIYDLINDMGYIDYFARYIMPNNETIIKELEKGIGLNALATYLRKANNYKIYHTKNDYLINTAQLKQLKNLAGNNLFVIDNGAHMGFLYREEFQNHFKKVISSLNKTALNN
ncbi:VacJ family lipoprotein [bacterium]|nr:VacJ family lipoprotein [bacterium]